MNALELAVWLNLYRKNDEQYSDRYLSEASEMLRQQQTRITELEEQRDQAWKLLKEYQK